MENNPANGAPPAPLKTPIGHKSSIDGAENKPPAKKEPEPGLDSTASQDIVLKILPWLDPVTDKLGHSPKSDFVEIFWLPILGPSSVLLMRRLETMFEDKPEGFEIAANQLAQELGIGMKSGPNSPFFRSLNRCGSFGLVHLSDNYSLFVKRHIPGLNFRLIKKLPAHLQKLCAETEQGQKSSGFSGLLKVGN